MKQLVDTKQQRKKTSDAHTSRQHHYSSTHLFKTEQGHSFL